MRDHIRKYFRYLTMVFAFVAAAGCTPSPQQVSLSNGTEISVTTVAVRGFSNRPEIFDQLQRLELKRDRQPYRFAISPSVIPGFSVYTGAMGDGTPIVGTQTSLRDGRLVYSVFQFSGWTGGQVRLSSPDDWHALASPEPKAILAGYREDCERLPYTSGLRRYGVPGFNDPISGVEVFASDGPSLDCKTAMHPETYGILIRSGHSVVLLSSVAGQVFIEEIRQ